MKSGARIQIDSHLGENAEPRISSVEDWVLLEYAAVGSTNLVAANLTAWHAVRADTQTAGRGRFQRSWVSDAGGLWLSAMVPVEFNSPGSRALPLAVGLAVCDVLRSIGVQKLRMRWPNDILVDDRKLAGLLIDQFKPGLAVIGIGVNVRNQPEARDSSLTSRTTRLADLVPNPPTLPDLTALILRGLRRVANEMQSGNFRALLPQVNHLWERPRKVELDLDGNIRSGMFQGVDEDGRLILLDEAGDSTAFAPAQVRRLTEISS
jgi:BirA family biotin operon repressor/biotin-[acetyl-CoA-carboxylase] ligase